VDFSESALDTVGAMSTLSSTAMSEKAGKTTLLTLDAAGEFAAGATVLAAYWPKDSAQQVLLRTHAGGRRELLIPLEAGVIEKALSALDEWASLRTGVSMSARLLHQRIRAEAARASCTAAS
jgi:hypothetical protein